MLFDRVRRWCWGLDLERFRPRRRHSPREIDNALLEVDNGRSGPRIAGFLRLILLNSLIDQAIAAHFFYDEDNDMLCTRYCVALPPDVRGDFILPSCAPLDDNRWYPDMGTVRIVHPDPTNPAYRRVWCEASPPLRQVAPRFFRMLARLARLHHGGGGEGNLLIRFEGRDIMASVLAPRPDDVRIHYGAERPPIRPKLARHYAELGLPPDQG